VVVDDEKTRWAVDVMTAWTSHGDDGAFVHDRIHAYHSEAEGLPGLVTGLVNLSGLLLMGMEATTGKSPQEILQAIGSTLARQGQRPGGTRSVAD
jgi:hypothetical protein